MFAGCFLYWKMSYLWLSGFAGCLMFCVCCCALSHIPFGSTSSLQPRSTLNTSLYECLYALCLYLLVHVRLAERNDVQMFEESSVGVLAFMSKRTSLVSNVMHSVRHALHMNLHMFVCLQAVFFIGTWAIYGLAGLLGARCSVFAVARYPIAFVSSSSLQPRSTLDTS